MNKGYRTQWVGQFAVASVLTRRGYLVSMPLSNVPSLDLQCRSQNGRQFLVQVKSLSSKGFFPIQKMFVENKNMNSNLFFVFVYVPPGFSEPLEYFILSHKQLLLRVWKEAKKDRGRRENIRKRKGLENWKLKWGENSEGIYYKFLNKKAYIDNWENLPT